MPRVQLEILRGPYQPTRGRSHPIESCRLLTDVSLRGPSGWTPFRPAVVDTGAPLCLLPRRCWDGAEIRVLDRIRAGGILRRPECMFEAQLAIIALTIRDPRAQIGPIEAPALLAESDDVPALIGMRGVLTSLVLHRDVAAGNAYLEST